MLSKVRVILSLFSLAVVVLYFLFPNWRLERTVRKACYERYAELGDPDRVKEVVDRNHGEIFEDCFVEGMPHRAKNFDVKKYARLMDQRVEKELGEALAAKLTASVAQKAPARAPGRPAAAPAPTPQPAAHAVDIRGVQIKPGTPKPEDAGISGKLFEIQVDVEDEAGDISFQKPPRVSFEVSCPDGEPFATEAPQVTALPIDSQGISHVSVRLLVPESTAGTGNGLCQLSVRVTDQAGNASQQSQRLLTLR